MIEEQWRDVPDAGGLYQVSDFGNVRSRRHANGLLLPDGEWRLSKLSKHPKGYLNTSINGRLRLVHDLVLEAFVGPAPAGQEGCHYPDQTKTNNNLTNLQWGTRSRNRQDAALVNNVAGQKLTPVQAREIQTYLQGRRLTQELAEEVATRYDIAANTVRNIRYGKSWRWLDDRTTQ